eukprot:355950_1
MFMKLLLREQENNDDDDEDDEVRVDNNTIQSARFYLTKSLESKSDKYEIHQTEAKYEIDQTEAKYEIDDILVNIFNVSCIQVEENSPKMDCIQIGKRVSKDILQLNATKYVDASLIDDKQLSALIQSEEQICNSLQELLTEHNKDYPIRSNIVSISGLIINLLKIILAKIEKLNKIYFWKLIQIEENSCSKLTELVNELNDYDNGGIAIIKTNIVFRHYLQASLQTQLSTKQWFIRSLVQKFLDTLDKSDVKHYHTNIKHFLQYNT